jgi:hypothetical protein
MKVVIPAIADGGKVKTKMQAYRLSFTAKAARCDDVHDMIPNANQNTHQVSEGQ